MYIKKINREEYKNIWNNSPSVFNNPLWLESAINSKQSITFYGVIIDNEIENAFPVVYQKGRFLKTITLPALTPFIGAINKKHLDLVLLFIYNQKIASISYGFPFIMKNTQKQVTHQINLLQTEHELFQNLRDDKKRNIKKALKLNVKVENKIDFDILSHLVTKTYERQGKKFQYSAQLKSILHSFPNLFQLNAYLDNKCVSSLLFVYDKTHCFYLLGGFDYSKNNSYAGPYTMWEGIMTAKSMNLECFDFEGSSINSIASYFKSFGGKESYYSTINVTKWYLKLIKKVWKK